MSGETALHHERVYIQVCQPAAGMDTGIVIRTCHKSHHTNRLSQREQRESTTMKLGYAISMALLAAGTMWVLPASAQNASPPEVLIDARRLNQVENPSEIDRWRKVIDTQEVRAIGDAVTSYYGCVGCYSMVGDAINTLVPLRNAGIEHNGVFQAPVGYTVCRAYAKNPSVNCNGTLTGSYRTADDPGSAGYDGLHWYIVVPRPGIGQGRCWVDATIVVEFLLATPGNRQRRNCGATGSVAFHYGK